MMSKSGIVERLCVVCIGMGCDRCEWTGTVVRYREKGDREAEGCERYHRDKEDGVGEYER